MSMQRAYWERIVSETILEASRGRTPNPDLLCNSRIKFGAFYDLVGKDFAKIASGHYAQTRFAQGQGEGGGEGGGESAKEPLVELVRAPDVVKDQTYFLAGLNQKQVFGEIQVHAQTHAQSSSSLTFSNLLSRIAV